MKAAAIIPARGGSRRIPGKNVKEFHGRPIIEYSIETAQRSGLFKAGIWVSTEDPAIAKVAWGMQAHVHARQKPLAQDEVGTQEVARSAALELFGPGLLQAPQPDAICVIYPCAPLMCTGDLHDGLQALQEAEAPYAYSVGPDGQDAGQWYWELTSALLAGVPLEHPRTKKVQIPAARVCDINTFEDWERAHYLYQAMAGARR